MSTDKLQALSNTLAEILSQPPSPPSFFDDEPHDSALASEQVAKASDNLLPSTDIPKENFGKLTSRKFGISPNKIDEADIVRDTAKEHAGIPRQALADQFSVAPQGDAGSWRFRSFAVILLAAGIGAATVVWLGSSGDIAKTAPSQLAALAKTTPTAAVSPELMPLLQSMARDLTSVGKEIEQLKASQEQLTRGTARLSEQLKASQEQVARDNANVAEQIKTTQDQLARINAQASVQNVLSEIATATKRPIPPRAQPIVPAARKPVPTVSSPLAAAKPNAEKPATPEH